MRALSGTNGAAFMLRPAKRTKNYKPCAALKFGQPPILKFLSYELQNTKKDEVYGVVERTLQNAFGGLAARFAQNRTLTGHANDDCLWRGL